MKAPRSIPNTALSLRPEVCSQGTTRKQSSDCQTEMTRKIWKSAKLNASELFTQNPHSDAPRKTNGLH